MVFYRGSYRIDVKELEDAAARYKQLGPQFPAVMTRTLNWVGARANTQVRRALSQQMGAPQKEIGPMLQTFPANYGRMDYIIQGGGRPLSLRAFGATQRAKGVSARPWGVRRLFRGTFIVASLGGSVYKRTGEFRTATKGKKKGQRVEGIEKLWGPAVPTEMVKGITRVAFEQTVKKHYPARIEHEVARALRKLKR